MDRRMGLPRQAWGQAAKETGPMLVEESDWHEVANTVPIQPGLGDMMIGSPMSVHNAVSALGAGVSYVGNMSQFAWNYPTWDGTDSDQMAEMVKALGIMAAKKADGAVVQSYLDDGYCAQFSDYTSYIGWTLFERYLVEELIGGALSVSWGGLTHDPRRKSAVTMALEAIKPAGRHNAFYNCDTTHYGKDIQRNYAALSLDVLYLVLTELRLKTGAAILPIPVTEPLRVPTLDETVEAHNITRRIIEDAPRLMELVQWEPIERERDRLVTGGRVFFKNLVAGHLRPAALAACGSAPGSDGDRAPVRRGSDTGCESSVLRAAAADGHLQGPCRPQRHDPQSHHAQRHGYPQAADRRRRLDRCARVRSKPRHQHARGPRPGRVCGPRQAPSRQGDPRLDP
jgi:hypothetical protein